MTDHSTICTIVKPNQKVCQKTTSQILIEAFDASANLANLFPDKELVNLLIKRSSLGMLLVAQSKRGICAISLGDNIPEIMRELGKQFKNAQFAKDLSMAAVHSSISNFSENPLLNLAGPFDIRGSPFQRRVWKGICEILPGNTMSYAEVAKKIGAPTSIQAVARACSYNCLALVIPCHRVVSSNGALSGYRWGIERKKLLLDREKKWGKN